MSRYRAYALEAGHSLGGALAKLAAIELRRACPDRTALDISCYTFGAPRTGNRAFAREYNVAVEDTWSIINDQVIEDVAGVTIAAAVGSPTAVMLIPTDTPSC